MITKKATKNNPKATTKKGYDLTKITTKKASQPKKKKSNALHTFFSVIGFIGVVGSLIAISTATAHAKEGVIIVEPFECKTEIANYHELLRALKVTSTDDFKYPIFQKELRLTVEALTAHKCEGFNNAK